MIDHRLHNQRNFVAIWKINLFHFFLCPLSVPIIQFRSNKLKLTLEQTFGWLRFNIILKYVYVSIEWVEKCCTIYGWTVSWVSRFMKAYFVKCSTSQCHWWKTRPYFKRCLDFKNPAHVWHFLSSCCIWNY